MPNETRYERSHTYEWWVPGSDAKGRVEIVSMEHGPRDRAARFARVTLSDERVCDVYHDEMPTLIAALTNYLKSLDAAENEEDNG